MRDFFDYFFGQGDVREFHYFSFAHILPILLLIGVVSLIIVFRDKLKNFKHEKKVRMFLAFLLIITEMSYFWRLTNVPSLNSTPVDHLPITVCGWAIIFCSYLSVTKSQTLFDIAYFWVFAGSIFGLATPTVIEFCGPTRFRYYQFWLEHTLGYVVIFYMIFVHGIRPNIKSMIKSYCALIVLGIVAIIANNLFPGANYLFMAKPEDTPSILDILPKNYGVRLMIMAITMATLFFLAYLPWFIMDIKKKKKQLETNTNQLVDPTITTTQSQTIDSIETNKKKTTHKSNASTNNQNTKDKIPAKISKDTKLNRNQ